jgi:KUP system potassium uptake protein
VPAERGGESRPSARASVLAFAALGVVFGDIGTSPLYALQAVFSADHGAVKATAGDVYGVVSLVAWSITLVVSIKFVTFVMRADNHGEGGVLALVALLRPAELDSRMVKAGLVAAGLFGVALFYGDGMITPAISVLSAVEGIEVAAPELGSIVLPVTLAALVGLFALQRFGTAAVARVFSPFMAIWFAVLAVVGAGRVAGDPAILRAFSPTYAIDFFAVHPGTAFISLGAIVLVVTGSEALYADMGHFGRRAISRAWFFAVFPALMLNYMGQGSLILDSPHAIENPFYLLFPGWARAPMIVLATVATLIASQAVISGAFSVTRQAVQIGILPRLRIRHTSDETIGQVYLGAVNWTLFVAVLGLVVGFGSSQKLATAYGIAVTGTLLIDSILFLVVARAVWRKPAWMVVVGAVVFVTVDLLFLTANLPKVAHGGWFPLIVGAAMYVVLTTWDRGRRQLTEARNEAEGPLDDFVEELHEPRRRSRAPLPTVGIYLHATRDTTPLALRVGYDRLRAIPEAVVIVSVDVTTRPHVPLRERAEFDDLGYSDDGISHIRLRYGYQDRLDVPRTLGHARQDERCEADFNPYHSTYFLSQMEIVPERNGSMQAWRKALFVAMARNAANPAEFFELPPERVVTLGTQVRF